MVTKTAGEEIQYERVVQIPGKLKLLDIGSGPGESAARFTFPEAEITRLDIVPDLEPDIVHDITQPFPKKMWGKYDVVFASHVLEHLYRIQVLPAILNVKQVLKHMGEFWVMVPDIEWAANQLTTQDNPHPGWWGVIYGSQMEDGENSKEQTHKIGFRLDMLRGLMEEKTMGGLVIRQAFRNHFNLSIKSDKDEKVFKIPQNVVIGMKYDPKEE